MAIPFTYSDLHLGLNTKDSSIDLQDGEARSALNVQGTTTGAITKRTGLSTIVSLSGLTSVFGGGGLIVASDGANIYKVLQGAPSTTTLKTGLATGTNWEWIRAPIVAGQGQFYGVNGSSTPQQFDVGSFTASNWTNASGSVAVPNGQYLIYQGNQAIMSGVTANPSRVYWSAIADPTNWDSASLTGAGFIDLDPNDGEIITGLGTVGPYILVGKPHKLWVITDTATAANRRISANVGIASHRSIAVGAEGTYFLAQDRGVYVTDGTSLKPISDKIQPTLDTILNRSTTAGAYWQQHYYLAYSTIGGPNTSLLDYDATLGSWWRHSMGSNLQQFAQAASVANVNVNALYCPSGLSLCQAFTPNVYTDEGSAYNWSWTGPWHSPTFYRRRQFPTPFSRKRLRQLRYGGFGQVDVSYATNFDDSTVTLLNSDVFSNSSTLKYARKNSLGVSDAFSIKFSGLYSTQAQIDNYVLYITDRRDSQPFGFG